MPWKETCQVQERLKLIMEIEKGEKPIALLCREYQISRQTAYKWLARHRQDPCALSLEDQSRRPLHHPDELDGERVDLIARARRTWPHWGPRKLRIKLRDVWPDQKLPSASTIGRVLKRIGLTHPRKRRRRTPPYTHPFAKCRAPNQLWCIDFKGQFRTGDGSVCYPLTITDAFSRFLLRCQIVGQPDTAETRWVLESAFREYGLPQAIRSDNGPPFASTGLGGLTELSAWLIRLGIRLERIEPGKPQQNGRHERMHLTLKRETASPARHSLAAQQRAFDRFRSEFNQQRPHEALGFATPASVYAPSARLFPERLGRELYPFDVERALVDKHGFIRWAERRVRIGAALRHELVELRPASRKRWAISFGPVLLGYFDERRWRDGVQRPRGAKVSAIS